MYDGPILNDPAAASDNVAWFQSVINDGDVPVLPRGTLYVNQTIIFPPKVGVRIESMGGRGYPLDGHPTMSGNLSRMVQTGNCPMFHSYGGGISIADPIELVGESHSACIEV